jgi:MYXO-CTERM domain-containing protein
MHLRRWLEPPSLCCDVWFVLALLLLPLIVGELQVGPEEPTHIYGGDYVADCGWPTAVYLQTTGGGACTGVLVHPLIVMTAAHCVDNNLITSARFGENAQTAQQLVETEYCRQFPGWTGATAQGQDLGYCRLSAPVTSVPIIPVAAGCEQTAIQAGARIMHVGFGVEETGDDGRKKMLDTVVNNISGTNELISGTFDEIICNGDSGGPTFVWLDPAIGGDGSWRVAAIHSWAQGADPVEPNCSGVAGSVLVSQGIDWIEEDSGIDITPCSDAGGTWNPTAHCGGLPMEPWTAEGTYTTACESGDLVAYSSVCGPPLDATPDATPPVVQVLTPTAAQEIPAEGGSALVDVQVDATDEGWGIATVTLTIRNVTVGQEEVAERNEYEPWSFAATLPGGAYEVVAVAIDHAGNESEPVTVCFGVGEPGCVGVTETDTDSETDPGSTGVDPTDASTGVDEDEDDDEGTGAAPPASRGDEGGCGCRAGDRGAPWLLALGMLGVLRRRSRR